MRSVCRGMSSLETVALKDEPICAVIVMTAYYYSSCTEIKVNMKFFF